MKVTGMQYVIFRTVYYHYLKCSEALTLNYVCNM
jgi:hypothetical protein